MNLHTYPLLRSIIRTLAIVGVILIIPLIAMRFTSEVRWKLQDFIIFGALLLVLATMIQLMRSNIKSYNFRVILIASTLLFFLYIYAELAVGIFTNLGS